MLNILVCLKQVPDTTEVKLSASLTLQRDFVAQVMNPADESALELGLKLRDQHGGKVTVITMGPARTETMLREAISRGADEAVQLTDSAFAGADTLATSYALSLGVKKLGGADLIVCGKMAVDGDTAQIGPELAQHLSIPHVSDVCEILEAADDHLIVRRVWDDAEQEVYLPLPALITVVKGQNLPKLPTIGGMLRGRTADISLFTAQSLNADVTRCGLKGSPTQVVRTFTPPVRGQAQEITGNEIQQASSLARIIREVTNGTD